MLVFDFSSQAVKIKPKKQHIKSVTNIKPFLFIIPLIFYADVIISEESKIIVNGPLFTSEILNSRAELHVCIDVAVDLAHRYCDDKSYKYINKVLDRIGKENA